MTHGAVEFYQSRSCVVSLTSNKMFSFIVLVVPSFWTKTFSLTDSQRRETLGTRSLENSLLMAWLLHNLFNVCLVVI